jgi:hypothetical protein
MAQADYLTSAIRAFITGASAKPSTTPIRAADADFIPRPAGRPPRPIPLHSHAVDDLEDRLDHLEKVFTASSAYMVAILSGTAENAPGGLDFCQVDGLLPGPASDIGALQHAVERMAWRVA